MKNPRDVVRDLIARDQWVSLSGEVDGELSLARFMDPLPAAREVDGYDQCVQVLWAFAPQGSKRSLTPLLYEITQTFETLLRPALEADALAVMTAMVTFDGARQWVFYTSDASTCEMRMAGLLAGEDYPVEVSTMADPGWTWLRDEIIGDKIERAVPEDGPA